MRIVIVCYVKKPFHNLKRGGRLEDGYLRVDIEEYLEVTDALERIGIGESIRAAAEDSPFSRRTLGNLYRDRRELYLEGDTDDERVQAAIEHLST